MILSRLNAENTEQLLPAEWLENIKSLLSETYKDQLKNIYEFNTFGFTYENEILLVISLKNIKSAGTIPVTLSLSADLQEKTDSKKLLDNIVDHVGLFFDQFFSDNEWDEYDPNWQKIDDKKQDIFYRVTRENVELTLQANQLLREN